MGAAPSSPSPLTSNLSILMIIVYVNVAQAHSAPLACVTQDRACLRRRGLGKE